MKVEVWFDVVCPFCYIGKRRLEKAIEQFDHSENVELQWKSFQLNPDVEINSETTINEYLADIKGWTDDQIKKMNKRLLEMASTVGLEYDLENTIVANSLNAHRLIQYAQTQNKGQQTVEALFKAFFTEKKNLEKMEILLEIAADMQLDISETREMLRADNFTGTVKKHIQEAQRMNIGGVPFFLFNRRFAISGAQQTQRFLNALDRSWKEEQPPIELSSLDDETEISNDKQS